MLAPTSAAVKFDLSSTPEQQACSMNIDQGLKTFWSLVERLQHAADQHQPIRSGRGDRLSGTLGHRPMVAPSVPRFRRSWGRWSDPDCRR